jgi:hypothetical protein
MAAATIKASRKGRAVQVRAQVTLTDSPETFTVATPQGMHQRVPTAPSKLNQLCVQTTTTGILLTAVMRHHRWTRWCATASATHQSCWIDGLWTSTHAADAAGKA